VRGRRSVAVGGVVVTLLAAGCTTLLGADATPVPGAAATLTRSINTPIPTPVRTPSALPVVSPSVARAAASPSSETTATSAQTLSDADVQDVQQRIEQSVTKPDLPGIEHLLLDHVALSTPDGGSTLSSDDAAAWLRQRAGQGISVTHIDRGTQEVMLQVQTDGWPDKDPIQQGQVNFSLRRYDVNGRQDETGGGEWKIDVIQAE
jgi:hypothetical protein